jgi:hypothetical protein
MKKNIVLLFLLTQVLTTMAEWAKIDGLNYNLNVEEKTASIGNNNSYNGILVIPDVVNYEGVNYTVTEIASNAFSNNYNLLSVTIPNTVKRIDSYSFSRCNSLSSVNIGDGVETIGRNAFSSCGIVSFTLGKNVSSIEEDVFDGCYALTQVHISDLAAWCHIEFEANNSNPLYVSHHLYLDKKEVKELVIPEGVKEIKKYAFSGATNITSLSINNEVTSIGRSAFSQCTSLNSVNFGTNLASIENYAFYECSSLESIELSDGIKSIGEQAFCGCSKLEDIKLPENLQIIKYGAFSGCTNLSNIIIPSKVEYIYGDAFNHYSSNINPLTVVLMTEYPPIAYTNSFYKQTKILVPDESFELYEGISPWSNFDVIPLSGTGPEKCAEPEIIYRDNKIIFSCQTPDVEFHYTITSEDFAEKKVGGQTPVLAIYQISVYATKAGYKKSDVVNKSINITTMPTADLTGDGKVNAADAVKIVNIIMGKEVYPND